MRDFWQWYSPIAAMPYPLRVGLGTFLLFAAIGSNVIFWVKFQWLWLSMLAFILSILPLIYFPIVHRFMPVAIFAIGAGKEKPERFAARRKTLASVLIVTGFIGIGASIVGTYLYDEYIKK